MTFAWQISEAEQRLANRKADYLRRWGWTQTCSTPGSYWLWQRDFTDYDAKFDAFYEARPDKKRPAPTGTMSLPTDLAVSMTIAVLDEQPEIGAED